MQKKEEKELVYYKILEKIMPAHIINAVGKLFKCGPSGKQPTDCAWKLKIGVAIHNRYLRFSYISVALRFENGLKKIDVC